MLGKRSLSVAARCDNCHMTRVVRGKDGRQWTLYAELEWRTPAGADEFEHDVSAGRAPGIVMLVLVVLLAVVLIVWTPPDVNPPGWLILLIVLVALFFPIRWSLRRPWQVIAATGDNGEGEPTEKWIGVVRGMFSVRSELSAIARSIREEGIPGFEGPLRMVDPVVPGDGRTANAATDVDDD